MHNNFVFCPIDRAGNNTGIVCKRFYVQMIIGELNFNNTPQADNTYELVAESSESIIARHIAFQGCFGLELEEGMDKLPPLHLTIKKHKIPSSKRVIVGSKMSSLKPLGKDLTKIFKLIFHFKRKYWRKAGFFSGVKNFWCTESNSDIAKTLDRINKKKGAKCISTYDFTTLY